MPWNNRCPSGGPDPFNPDSAVAAADFSASTFVQTTQVGATENLTRYAYTFVTVTDDQGNDWRVCVVGHIHYVADSQQWVSGHTFIPGWDQWAVQTSAAHRDLIENLAEHGQFPGDGRYPTRLDPVNGVLVTEGISGSTSGQVPEPGPVRLSKPSSSSSDDNLPVTKRYVFNETGNIMVASTVNGGDAITQAAEDLFQEVAVFFAALTKAVTSTPKPGTKAPFSFLDYYSLYDYEPIEAVVQRSGMFVTVEREDYTFHSAAGNADFNLELIESIIGFAVTDGAAVVALTNVLRSLGKRAAVSWNRTGKASKMGHLTFVCEYLMGMPLVNVAYYYLDESMVETVVHVGPCVSVAETSIDLAIHKDTFMFVPPAWIKKYSGDLDSVLATREFEQFVSELKSYITGTPLIISVLSSGGADAPLTLIKGSTYTISGLNFGSKSGTLLVGGIEQTVAKSAWNDTTISFTAVPPAQGAAVGPIIVVLASTQALKPTAQSDQIYTLAAS